MVMQAANANSGDRTNSIIITQYTQLWRQLESWRIAGAVIASR